MPAFLDSGDRRLVAGAFGVMLALLGATYLLRPAKAERAIGLPSSYSADWLGTKGAFLLLQRMNYRVERWESPPEELPENAAGVTLIFAEPSDSASTGQRAAVSRFVSAGGRLVVMGASGASFAPQSSAIPIPDSDLTPKPFPVLLPSTLSRDAPEVTMVAPDQWRRLSPSQLAIYGKDGNPAVVWYRFGKGQVIWWAISSPASNGSIRDKGNLALFLNSVGPRSSRILWDEYFHGIRRTLGSYFSQTPLPWAGWQIVLVFAALLVTFSRRSGPVRMPAQESRLSPLEFVDTLGDLYQSAHAAPGAVEVAYQRLRLALIRRLGMPSKTRLPELCHATAARFGWAEDKLFSVFSESEHAMRDIHLADRQALELVRELHDYSDRLETLRKPAKESLAWR